MTNHRDDHEFTFILRDGKASGRLPDCTRTPRCLLPENHESACMTPNFPPPVPRPPNT